MQEAIKNYNMNWKVQNAYCFNLDNVGCEQLHATFPLWNMLHIADKGSDHLAFRIQSFFAS